MSIAANSLIYFVTDSLARYSEDFQLNRRANPIEFRLNGRAYVVHVSSVHDSGEGRINPDEERIQISRSTREQLAAAAATGIETAFIGFFPSGSVFTAWEPDYVFSLRARRNGTVYARLSHEEEALNNGGAVRMFRPLYLGRDTPIISLRSDALGFYLENRALMHGWKSDADLRRVINDNAQLLEAGQKSGLEEVEAEIGGNRRTVTITRTAFLRDPRFRDAVLRAYDGRCCVCDRQLGLVEAAHVIPHGNPDSNDLVTNGLALCVEHHRLYDSVLLIPDVEQRLYLNPDRVEHLKNIGQDAGLDAIEQLANQQYRIPDHAPSRPNDEFLTRGKAIRLG